MDNIRTGEQLVTILAAEGHTVADIEGAITSLIDAGLDADQGDSDGYVFNDNDLDVLRAQLSGE